MQRTGSEFPVSSLSPISFQKKKMGKRRISMQRISEKQKRHVTFSKRRKGLFKKAQELCCLTGATVGIICFSEAGNPFTFCYPSPAEGQDGDDGCHRLLNIMQQLCTSSDGSTITVTHSHPQPAPNGELKSSGEENRAAALQQSATDDGKAWPSQEPLHAAGIGASQPTSLPSSFDFGWEVEDEIEMGLLLRQLQGVDAAVTAPMDSVFGQPIVEQQGFVDSSCYDSSHIVPSNNCFYSCLPPTPSTSIETPPSSLSSWNDYPDRLEMEAFGGDIIPSLFLPYF